MSHHKYCRIKECEQKLYAAGYCKAHYDKEMSKGSFKEIKKEKLKAVKC